MDLNERMEKLLTKQEEVKEERKRQEEEKRRRDEEQRKKELEERIKPLEEHFLSLSERAVEKNLIVCGIRFHKELFLTNNYNAITIVLDRADEKQLQRISQYEDVQTKNEITGILRKAYQGAPDAYDRFTLDIDEYYTDNPFIKCDFAQNNVLIRWKTIHQK